VGEYKVGAELKWRDGSIDQVQLYSSQPVVKEQPTSVWNKNCSPDAARDDDEFGQGKQAICLARAQ
jgi:hypothetical protein